MKHHHRELTLSESALFTLERKKHVLFTRENKVLFLFPSVVHEIKESLDETRRRLLKGAAFRSLAAKRSKREREKRIENVPVGVDGTNAERNAGENRARTEKGRGDDSVSGATYTAVVVV